MCCAVLLLLMGSVLCVWRCAGVRRARAVRECVLESRVRLWCCARAGVCWMMYCVVRLFTVLWSASLAGRAARWAAARCELAVLSLAQRELAVLSLAQRELAPVRCATLA